MANTILVDASNRVYAHHLANKLTVGQFQVQAIFGIVREIHALVERNPGWSPIVLWDGYAQWRYDVFPEYKSGREKRALEDPDSAERKRTRVAQVPYIRKALTWMGIHQMYARSQEADDMAGYLSGRFAQSGSLVRLISSDTDWSQLVNENVQCIDTINDKKYTHLNYFDMTGYRNGMAYIQGKALIGDTSDSIDGIAKIGKKTASDILAEFGDVETFFSQVDSGVFVPKYVKHKNLASAEGREKYRRNMKLMCLIGAAPPKKDDVVVLKPELDKSSLQAMFERLNFRSILRDYDEWFAPLAKRYGAA